jgi:hypothetical protein
MNNDDRGESSYDRLKQRVNKKITNARGDMLEEIREELQEHDEHVQLAKNVALGMLTIVVFNVDKRSLQLC